MGRPYEGFVAGVGWGDGSGVRGRVGRGDPMGRPYEGLVAGAGRGDEIGSEGATRWVARTRDLLRGWGGGGAMSSDRKGRGDEIGRGDPMGRPYEGLVAGVGRGDELGSEGATRWVARTRDLLRGWGGAGRPYEGFVARRGGGGLPVRGIRCRGGAGAGCPYEGFVAEAGRGRGDELGSEGATRWVARTRDLLRGWGGAGRDGPGVGGRVGWGDPMGPGLGAGLDGATRWVAPTRVNCRGGPCLCNTAELQCNT